MKKYIFIFVSALSVYSCAPLPNVIPNRDGETFTWEKGKKIICKPPDARYYESAVFHDSLHTGKQKNFALDPESQLIHIDQAMASKHSSCRMPRIMDVVGFMLDLLGDIATVDHKKTKEAGHSKQRSFSGRKSGR